MTMIEMPPLTESADSVPCPHCGGSGEVESGRVIAGNAHEPAEPVLRPCRFCDGAGEVPPVMLDAEFWPVPEGTNY